MARRFLNFLRKPNPVLPDSVQSVGRSFGLNLSQNERMETFGPGGYL